MQFLKKILIVFVIITALSFYQLKKWTMENGPLFDVVNVVIPKGASSGIVANELAKTGVLNKPWLFKLVARFNGLDKELKAGEYQFNPHISMLSAMQKIANGEVYLRKITLPEGLTSGQIMYMLSKQPDLAGEITLDVREGEILPETYSYVLGDTKDSIIIQAKKSMSKILSQAWNARMEGLPYKNINEALTMASIIEKETAIADERGLVASVFLNRLKKGMRLQTDPTVIYALTNGEYEFGRSLVRSDLNYDSPYNTYKIYGLPPAPICNPGKDAIWAALNPESSDFLYFVADGKGGHSFAKSLNEHNDNVRTWKKVRNNSN